MDKNFDKKIRELLQSHTEQPSAACWDKIETQLDALQTTNANSGSSSSSSPSPSGNASAFSQFAGTVTGKIVSAAVAVATIGGVVSLIIVNSTDTAEQSEAKIIKEETQNNLPANENNVWTMNETDTSHTSSEAKTQEHVDMTIYCFDEQKDTTTYQENVLPVHSDHTPSENSVSHTRMENETKQETTPKTDHKSQSIEKTQEKEVSDIQETPLENSSEKENMQDKLEQPEIKIPNVFTPNGDNVNDYFVIEGMETLSETHLHVFRRDGKIIYEKTNYQNDWQADNVQDGVYFYVFKYIYQGTQFMRRGSITIKR
jgi:gliding motility-associated-like protein